MRNSAKPGPSCAKFGWIDDWDDWDDLGPTGLEEHCRSKGFVHNTHIQYNIYNTVYILYYIIIYYIKLYYIILCYIKLYYIILY